MKSPLEFRDPERARRLLDALAHLTRDRERDPISVMHVCGSHEQAVARFGLRAALPPGLDLIMGPGCPVCVTDCPEIDEAVALARAGLRIATYGDMLRVPGSGPSLADAAAEGARVDVVYSVTQAAELARRCDEEIVFFASGFETTAVATAAVLLDDAAAEPVGALGAQVHPAGHGDRGGDARQPRAGLPRRGPRRDDHRLGRLRAVRGAAAAGPSWWRASSRSTSSPPSSRWSGSCARARRGS